MTSPVGFATNGLLIPNANYFPVIFVKVSPRTQLSFSVKISVLIVIIVVLGTFCAKLSAKENDQAEIKNSPKSHKSVLNPEKFSGQIAAGYKAAQQARDVCSRLFCYCGCDLTDEHLSLLDCFTSMHGVDCAICQEEATIAWNMKKQGKSIAQTQKVIDETFSSQYPWDEPSPALERYLKSQKAPPRRTGTRYNTNVINGAAKTKKNGHCCGH